MDKDKPNGKPVRITRKALSVRMETPFSTIYYHMGKPGAPKPDRNMKFDPVDAEKWVREGMQWAGGGQSPQAKTLKDRKLALEVEEMEATAAVRRGEFVSLKLWQDTISALWVAHEAVLRQKFEHELPRKYAGKTEEERRQLNVKALLEVAEAFKSGQLLIETQMTQAKP